ncbi:MAG: signal transduction protein [Euryarchaeota archaeon CG01_land_8_20_14_3_00_38_12]|nr:MAG: signal transduction protein [Euryarchaeota archaeon CG01_land_8_20_14_3_00_38_12]
MLKDTVNGLDKVLEKDIPPGFVILIKGSPGTLKSGFMHNVLSNYLSKEKKEFGVYATIEETKESHLRNMRSLGIKMPDNMEMFDYSDIRTEWKKEEKEGKLDIVKITEDIIKFYKEEKKENFTIFALDSFSALCSLAEVKRGDSYHFFTLLRNSGLTSFVAQETDGQQSIPESFLADGVVELGTVETHEDVVRYIQVKKMRAVKHSMKKHQLIVESDGLSVLEPVYEK